MIQLIYCSVATVPFSDADLIRLLYKSRERNSLGGVSGLLVFQNQRFLQVLEGPQVAVDEIFERVHRDPRHDSVDVLLRLQIREPEFRDWSMGFVHAQPSWARQLPGFADLFQRNPTGRDHLGPLSQRLLRQFCQGALRREVETGVAQELVAH